MEGGMARQTTPGHKSTIGQDRLQRLLLSLPGVWKRGGNLCAYGSGAEGAHTRPDLGPSLAAKFMREHK